MTRKGGGNYAQLDRLWDGAWFRIAFPFFTLSARPTLFLHDVRVNHLSGDNIAYDLYLLLFMDDLVLFWEDESMTEKVFDKMILGLSNSILFIRIKVLMGFPQKTQLLSRWASCLVPLLYP
jgi:hypothetical protein